MSFCSQTSDDYTIIPQATHEIVKPELVKSIKINVDTIQYSHRYKSVYNGDEDWYLGLDKGRNAIDVFNITNETYSHAISMKKDSSPNAIDISDFFVHNSDTIFIFDKNQYKLMIVNLRGEIIDLRVLRNKELQDMHDNKVLYGIDPWHGRMYYDKYSKMIFFGVDMFELPSHPDYFIQKFLLPYSLEEDLFFNPIGKFPSNYRRGLKTPSNTLNHCSVIQSYNDGTLLLSFVQSHFKQIFDWRKDSVIGRYPDRSYFLTNKFASYDGSFEDSQVDFHYLLQYGAYLRIAFQSPYDGYYYNVVTHDQPLKDEEGRLNVLLARSWSVMKMDSDFNVVSEAIFQKNIFRPFDTFPCRLGILVSKESNENPNNNEDYLEFDVYTF